MSRHVLKVAPPYFEAVADGRKTFEVRRNDRAYQTGDILTLWEFNAKGAMSPCTAFPCASCKPRSVDCVVTFVYSGDPRFGGLEPGTVVLALGTPTPTPGTTQRVIDQSGMGLDLSTPDPHPPHDGRGMSEEVGDGE